MYASKDGHGVSFDGYDAWLFDLDGVVTDKTNVHAAAWKETFDEYLREVSERNGTPFEPFEVDPDGKPRYEGVDSFLRSRGIALAWGSPEDPPDQETVCGLGNRKNAAFNEVLKRRGVEVFGSSVALIRNLREDGGRVAVATSSKNCVAVLAAAGIGGLFDARVDGNVAAERGSPASPRPTRSWRPRGRSGRRRSGASWSRTPSPASGRAGRVVSGSSVWRGAMIRARCWRAAPTLWSAISRRYRRRRASGTGWRGEER